jgi:hypothetical protein
VQRKGKKEEKMVTRVGFEPTQITLLAPEASALDRSAILPDDMNNSKNIHLIPYKKVESHRCEDVDAGRRSGEVRGKNRHFAKLGKAGCFSLESDPRDPGSRCTPWN